MADHLFPFQRIVFDQGAPGGLAAGGSITYYQAGTLTLVPIFSDPAGTIPQANPVPIASDGTYPSSYYTGSTNVRAIIRGADGLVLQDIDVVGRVSSGTSSAADISFTPVTGNSATNVDLAIRNNTNRLESIGFPGDRGQQVFEANTREGILGLLGLTPYQSDERVFANSGTYFFAHGKGVAPDWETVEVICQVADHGYSPGDVLTIAPAVIGDTGYSLQKTATNIVIRVGATGIARTVRLTDKVGTTLTTANWRLRVTAGIYLRT